MCFQADGSPVSEVGGVGQTPWQFQWKSCSPSLMTQHLWSVNTGGKSLHVIKKILLLEVLAGPFDEMKVEVPGEYAGRNLSVSVLIPWLSDDMISDLRSQM